MIVPSLESHQCLEEMWKRRLGYTLAAKRSAGVAPEINLRECVARTPPSSMNKAAHSGFETQRRRHQNSKTRVSVAIQKRTHVL